MTFPLPTPVVAKTQLVMDWITSLGWNEAEETGYPLRPGPEILDAPDRMVTITVTPGPGWITEEAALDCWGFQTRVRGPSDTPLEPDLKSQQLDVLILNADTPVVIDGMAIILVTRVGSTPSPLPLDPRDRRFEYVCSYLITTGGE